MPMPHPDFECTRRTAVFTKSSLPTGLTENHRTRADTWVAVNVKQDVLFLYLAGSQTPITVDPSQSASPQPLQFYLAFYCRRAPEVVPAKV